MGCGHRTIYFCLSGASPKKSAFINIIPCTSLCIPLSNNPAIHHTCSQDFHASFLSMSISRKLSLNLYPETTAYCRLRFVCIWVVTLLYAVMGFYYKAFALPAAFSAGLIMATFIFLIQVSMSFATIIRTSTKNKFC